MPLSPILIRFPFCAEICRLLFHPFFLLAFLMLCFLGLPSGLAFLHSSLHSLSYIPSLSPFHSSTFIHCRNSAINAMPVCVSIVWFQMPLSSSPSSICNHRVCQSSNSAPSTSQHVCQCGRYSSDLQALHLHSHTVGPASLCLGLLQLISAAFPLDFRIFLIFCNISSIYSRSESCWDLFDVNYRNQCLNGESDLNFWNFGRSTNSRIQNLTYLCSHNTIFG